MSNTFAIFIDGDNISPKYFKHINEIIRSRGTILLKRVYVDFTEESGISWKKTCLEFGIEPIIAWREKRKNSTDLKMTVDIMDILNNYKHINNFVLVTGDTDFKELVNKIISNGKYVIGISSHEKSTSYTLRNFCSEFIILEKLSIDNKKILIQHINEILRESLPMELGLLKSNLLNINPIFNEINFGYKSFSELIRSLKDDVVLEKDSMNNYWASIKK